MFSWHRPQGFKNTFTAASHPHGLHLRLPFSSLISAWPPLERRPVVRQTCYFASDRNFSPRLAYGRLPCITLWARQGCCGMSSLQFQRTTILIRLSTFQPEADREILRMTCDLSRRLGCWRALAHERFTLQDSRSTDLIWFFEILVLRDFFFFWCVCRHDSFVDRPVGQANLYVFDLDSTAIYECRVLDGYGAILMVNISQTGEISSRDHRFLWTDRKHVRWSEVWTRDQDISKEFVGKSWCIVL